MKNSRYLRASAEAPHGALFRTHRAPLAAALVAAALLAASCGGPYTPKRIGVARDKLALADRLFERGKFSDAAVEYKDFLTTFAGDDRSDYAQFRLSESYRLDKQYALAEVEYRIVITEFSYSQYVDDAFYLEAVSALRQAPRIERDQSKAYEALARVQRFLEMFPSSDRAAEAKATLGEIQNRLARKEFMNARLYVSKKAHDAALIYLDKVIVTYPETVWAVRCRYYRGNIRELQGDAEGAAADYRAVAESSGDVPERSDAQSRLGGAASRAGGAKPDDGGPN